MGESKLSRVYDHEPRGSRGCFLVERLWPRGVWRDALEFDGWLPEVGSSHELRKWLGHDPKRWEQFHRRYFAELDARLQAWQPLIDAAAAGDVTLLYSSRDRKHNNAVALRDYLQAHH